MTMETMPRPEHPFPQFERKNWRNLNGTWDFAFDMNRSGLEKGFAQRTEFEEKILVPFCPESDLSGIGYKDFIPAVWYHRTLEITEQELEGKVYLHFGAVDYDCRVFVNGKEAGRHQGGYVSFAFEISTLLQAGENHLVVYAEDDTRSPLQPTGKQSDRYASYACSYTRTTGIWQTVWLEPVDPVHIEALMIRPDVDNSCLKVRVNASLTTGVSVNINLLDKAGDKVAAIAGGKVGRILTLPIENPHLWSVDDPYLYDLDITIIKDGVQTDAVSSYCGMRKIEVKKVGETPRIFLNGEQIFQMGPLDQGWWPDGLYTAPSDEALLFDIKAMKSLGFNMIRKHIKVEPARWYMHCDREGILVWQDLPSPNLPSGHEDFAKKTFQEESVRIIEAFRNHPSIIQWIVFNEGWGQFDTERMTQIVQGVVGQTLVCCASGWNDADIGDIKDSHSYPDPSCPLDRNRAAVCGEYGGITLKVQGHVWPGGDFQYTTVETGGDFTVLFNRLADKIKDYYYYGLNAAVYTQLSDVEIERNGILTYDRRVLKPYSATGELKAII